MADELMREVDEDIRRERMQLLWRRYRTPLLILVAVAVLGAGGWSVWQDHQHKQAGIAMQKLDAGIALMNADQPAQAATQFAALARDADGELRDIARLWLGRAQTKADQPADAVVTFTDLATEPASADLVWRDMACLRLMALDAPVPDRCQSPDASPLKTQRLEWYAATLWSAQKPDAARALLTQLADDETAGQPARERAARLLRALPETGETK